MFSKTLTRKWSLNPQLKQLATYQLSTPCWTPRGVSFTPEGKDLVTFAIGIFHTNQMKLRLHTCPLVHPFPLTRGQHSRTSYNPWIIPFWGASLMESFFEKLLWGSHKNRLLTVRLTSLHPDDIRNPFLITSLLWDNKIIFSETWILH